MLQILEAGRRAPSDATGFMYTVIRVKDPGKRNRIAALTGTNPHIVDASDFFVVCLDFHRQREFLRHIGARQAPLGLWALLFGTVDAILVAENMAVAAEALGYGTGFIGGVQKNALEIGRLVGCPEGVFPVVGLTMGFIARDVKGKKRLPLSATVHEDNYRELSEAEVDACFGAMKSESGKWDWGENLKRYFAEGGEMHSREPVIRQGLLEQRILK